MRYTEFETTLKTALDSDGKVALPNMKEVTDPADALKRLSLMWPYRDTLPYRLLVGQVLAKSGTHMITEMLYWPKVFLHTDGMASRFDGSGMVLSSGRAFSFNTCEHSWDCSGANHSRGWHPKHCTKCGFDASIDSGD